MEHDTFKHLEHICAVGCTFTEAPGAKGSKGFTSTRTGDRNRDRDRCWREHLRVRRSICGSDAVNARKVETFARDGSTTWTNRHGATSANTYGCTTTWNATSPLRISEGKTTSPHTTTFARPLGRWEPARNIRGGAKCWCFCYSSQCCTVPWVILFNRNILQSIRLAILLHCLNELWAPAFTLIIWIDRVWKTVLKRRHSWIAPWAVTLRGEC